ncbi:MAG: chromate efflux transporter [Devosia sp.]
MREATAVWARIGLLSFGGPAGQIALMHRELVEERRWISESRFLHALNFCMLLPGPEAQQLATYVGWLLHGWRGGLIAGTLFVLPGFFVILALSATYAVFHEVGWLASLFFGLKAAVLAIVVEATLRVGRRALHNRALVGLAVAAFLALFVFNLPFPIVVLAAGLIGYFGARLSPTLFVPPQRNGGADDAPAVIDHLPAAHAGLGHAAITLVIGIALWLAPLALIVPALGTGNVFASLWLFFSQMAVVTFGGAYAVLAYVAQEAVQGFGWLQPGEMVDGLALAETTPGPLVLVLSFVGFLAAFRAPLGMDPLLAGLLGAILTAWVTFVPCFLWIFLGAPYVERLRSNLALSGALTAITASIVGVIFNLALWFALHVLFREVTTLDFGPVHMAVPVWLTLDPIALALSIVAAIALLRLHLGIIWTLLLTGVLGILAGSFGLA